MELTEYPLRDQTIQKTQIYAAVSQVAHSPGRLGPAHQCHVLHNGSSRRVAVRGYGTRRVGAWPRTGISRHMAMELPLLLAVAQLAVLAGASTAVSCSWNTTADARCDTSASSSASLGTRLECSCTGNATAGTCGGSCRSKTLPFTALPPLSVHCLSLHFTAFHRGSAAL